MFKPRPLAAFCCAAAFLAAGAAAAQPSSDSGPVVRIHGMISASVFAQDRAFGFGNGQNAVWAATGGDSDRWFVGGDVRNTRLSVELSDGDVVDGWLTSSVIEIDFFGGFAGSSAFSDEQPHPRLRSVFVDLSNGRTSLRVGQATTPLFGYVPASLSHVAFPLGLGSAGVIGWRQPGVFLKHRLNGAEAPVRVGLQLAAFRGSWSGPGSTVDHLSAGEAAVIPQLEARIDLDAAGTWGTWSLHVTGHYDRKDLSVVGAEPFVDGRLDGTAFQLGGRVMAGRLTVHGNVYSGRAIGQQFGQATQFGDIGGWGGWLQMGATVMPRTSVWLFHGFEDPVDDDVRSEIGAGGRFDNVNRAAMLKHGRGAYAVGLEWLQSRTRWSTDELHTGGEDTSTGNQLAFSVLYTF
jgi:hypothetical protein